VPIDTQPSPSSSPITVQPTSIGEIDEAFQELPESASIIVKNLVPSPNPDVPTTKALADFFSFCGNITSMSIIPDESDENSVSAVITFENSTAARTALLLNHTVLNERTILVELAPFNLSEPTSPVPQSETPRIEAPPNATQTSVVSSLLAHGYKLSQDAAEKARRYDEQHKISSQMNEIAKNIENSVNNIDQQYQISDKINHVVGQVNAFDQEYQISTKVNEVVDQAQTQVAAINSQYHISENVAAAAEQASTEGARLMNTVSEELQLEQRSKEASEAISHGVAQVSEFLETNETAKGVVEGAKEVGTYLSSMIGNAFSALVTASQEVEMSDPNIVHETVDTR